MCQGESSSSEIQVDKHRLVAKVVQLQTLNASLMNKVEFLQGHVDQLNYMCVGRQFLSATVKELLKSDSICQSYAQMKKGPVF